MGLSAPTARLNPSPAPTAWVSSPIKSRALKGQIKPCHHRQNLPNHALPWLLGGFLRGHSAPRPPLLPRLAKRAACTPVAPARNLNSFGSRFLPPPHSRRWHRAIKTWGNACDGKTAAPNHTPQTSPPDAHDLAKRPQIPHPRGTAIQHQRCGIIVEHPTKLKALAP